MVKWGKRLRVRYQSRHIDYKKNNSRLKEEADEEQIFKEEDDGREFEKLMLKKEDEELAIMTTPNFCVTSQNVDHDNLITPSKGNLATNASFSVFQSGHTHKVDEEVQGHTKLVVL